MIDLSDVVFIKRIVIGSSNPTDIQSEERIDQAMALINRCLSDYPRGKIIGIEKSFSILQVGEHNVVLQWTTYHIGFTRRPQWLEA
ncbi:MAG: hypothetical protein KC420_12050 [Myxococcales bacterium]|nr:hypothetical protein [Myxococcales bacterium]MCB9569464.1 hypothetical protein [Myxococcales bacterium]MCB9706208.1 hypothetical protein [Myxococcales bacterium]